MSLDTSPVEHPAGFADVALPQSDSGVAPSPSSSSKRRAWRWAVGAVRGAGLVGLTAGLVGLPWIFPSLFFVAWVGMGLMALIASQLRPFPAFAYGYLSGIGALGIAFHWSVQAIAETVQTDWNVASAVFAGLLMWEGLQMAIFAALVAWVVGKDLSRAWAIPFLWVVPEFWWPKIFPWSMAHLQTDYPLLLQTADWGGVPSVSFLFMLAASVAALLLARAAWRWRQIGTPSVALGRQLATASGLFLLVLAAAWLRQQQVQWAADRSEQFTAAAIQIDPTFVGWIDKLRDLSRQVESEADLICWPESSTGTYDEALGHFRDVSRTIRHSRMPNPATTLLPDAKCHLLAGAKTYQSQNKKDGPYRNTALLVAPDQSIVDQYVKRALMPIGEYMPGEHLYPELRTMANIDKDIIPGTAADPLTVSGVAQPGVLICYEDLVTWTARSTVAQGADCLVALVNASAFTNPITLDQHYRLAMLRSVENRRALIRCSATGITSVVSPTGELLASVPCFAEAALVQQVPRMKGTSFYTRYGDTFAYFCTAVTVGLVCVGARRRHRQA